MRRKARMLSEMFRMNHCLIESIVKLKKIII